MQLQSTWMGRMWGREGGATLAEFAVTLPLLAAIAYAVFDFGGALVLKQKLEQAVYETARLAASQSTDDFTSATVDTAGSIAALRDSVARNLRAAGVNDCGLLGTASTAPSPTTAVWVYTVSGGGCPAPMVLTIRRQNAITVLGSGTMFYSRVTLQYPYAYHLGAILSVLTPGGTFPASANLVVNASMKNLI